MRKWKNSCKRVLAGMLTLSLMISGAGAVSAVPARADETSVSGWEQTADEKTVSEEPVEAPAGKDSSKQPEVESENRDSSADASAETREESPEISSDQAETKAAAGGETKSGETETGSAASVETVEEAAKLPAQDFSGSAGTVKVTVHADEGCFPEGTTMHLRYILKARILNNDRVQEAVGADRDVVDALAVDITFQDKDGREIEPADAISVSMSAQRDVEGDSHQVLHIDDDGSVEKVSDADAGGAEFDADRFSIYVIAGVSDPAVATYIFHSADGEVLSTQKVKNGETVYAPDSPEKSGSKFLGWSYTENAASLSGDDPGSFSSFSASVSETGEVNLYPVF
jgi:hypothetical protein